MRYKVNFLTKGDKIEWESVLASNSYRAFKTALELMDTGQAIECIVFVSDGNEWVKVANVRDY